eukprot:TRINITY_DN9865_c0_g1_i3.p1 TRINITY_DN9865_c0_g1~~TRINITY_DN9865_c0_g1_i3.p1  ORF type:complete len:378 (+),score=48.70 TRINITY_DN9865_c0_g1_i3:117-1250(+)
MLRRSLRTLQRFRVAGGEETLVGPSGNLPGSPHASPITEVRSREYLYPVAEFARPNREPDVTRDVTYGNLRLVRDVAECREHAAILRFTTPPSRVNRRYALGFVPTMGAIHEAHLALVEASQAECAFTMVSIFVNPTQFAQHEDLGSYPRPLEKDLELLRQAGVDTVWLPTSDMMYPAGFNTYVEFDGVRELPEGHSRPHFFRGVGTVCTKLFNIVRPNRVYVGQKDAVQCVVLKALVRDLNMDSEVVVCPTVRELDGLAFSSRNVYLSAEDRVHATVLYRALSAARSQYKESSSVAVGDPAAERIKAGALKAIVVDTFKDQQAKLLYVSVASHENMKEFGDEERVPLGSIISCAAMLGKTRLLDCLRLGVSEDDYW